MATKSANLYARIEPDVKEKAESILYLVGAKIPSTFYIGGKDMKYSLYCVIIIK